jgi:hypothetical protein
MYNICFEEKSKMSKTNVSANATRNVFVKSITEDHEIVTFNTLFAEEQVAVLQINSPCTSSDEDLIRTVTVHLIYDGKQHSAGHGVLLVFMTVCAKSCVSPNTAHPLCCQLALAVALSRPPFTVKAISLITVQL